MGTSARVQIQQIEKEQRRPVARPVDTFVRPGRSSLRRLAGSLAQFSPSLLNLGLQLQRERDIAQFQEGEQFVRELATQGEEFRKAIQSGRITADKSPFFRLGAEEQAGRIMADRFNAELQRAMVTQPGLRDATDPTVFDSFITQFREKFVEENIGAGFTDQFERGFGPRALAYTQNARLAFESRSGGALIEQVKNQTYQEFRNIIQQETLAGRDPAELLVLTDRRQGAIGLTGRELSNIVTQAVIDEAEARDDLIMLLGEDGKPDTGDELLSRIPTGKSGGKVGQRPDTVQAVGAAIDRIIRRRQAARSAEWTAIARERSEAKREARIKLVTDFIQGQDTLDEVIRMDPDNADEHIRLFTTLQEGRFGSDRGVVQELLSRINAIGDPQHPEFVSVTTLIGALDARQIDQQDFAFLQGQLDSREERRRRASEDGKDPYRNPLFQDAQRELDQFFGRNPLTGGYDSPQQAERARSGQARLTDAWLDWIISDEGRKASARDQNRWLFEAVSEIGNALADPFVKQDNERAGIPGLPQVTRREFERIEAVLNSGIPYDEIPDDIIDIFWRAGVRDAESLQAFMEQQRALLFNTQSQQTPSGR